MADGHIAVDLEENSDEDYQSGAESQTTSLSSTIFQYEYENGRRYHAYKAGTYAIPNDETEQERLDVMHHIYNMLLGGRLHVAPLEKPQRILDIGTGTGIWAIEMADQYPQAEVIGTDLSPIQPSWVPPNVQFQIDDCELDWTYEKNSFDFIHIRGLQLSCKNWPRLLKQAYDHLKPGGWVEVVEWAEGRGVTDDGTDKGTAIYKYYDRLNEAGEKIGRPFRLPTPLKEMIPAAGFVNYREEIPKLPFSPWPADKKLKLIGRWYISSMESGFEAYGLALFTRVLKMDQEEGRELCAAAWKDVQGRKVHMYANTYFACGQKPLE
ncbi:S-adenosyl-L-methionine-dependent methyltransferase [Sphaerosporella brunnea]|uniref:S-adenosyl-L-methionine-dependent methyltransferase n=1 Tax=Sphaerosporella brunnea TaxID=1250544 RepID=A0A5J5EIE9_9PEZI|nr:S-adenosyl-L-methionine-dependent methyltransferase [Sphaerosporella brunnea]